jgi:L-fuconolactonase
MTAGRSFLQPPVRQDWLDLLKEEIIDPQLPIVDTHHHLHDERVLRGFFSARYLDEEIVEDVTSGHNVVATVFIQCGWKVREHGPEDFRYVAEMEAMAALAARVDAAGHKASGICEGAIGYADLRGDRLEEVLEALFDASEGRFRGIRQSAALDDALEPNTSVVQPRDLLKEPTFWRGLRLLGAKGYTYDSWQYHTQLKDLANAARQAPETRIIVDHTGGPLGFGPYAGRSDEVFRVWTAGMKDLATCPNVYVKLGGLAMTTNGAAYHKNALPPRSERLAADWKPWFEACIDVFGADRCMFESNFSYDKGMCSYVSVWNAFKRIAERATPSEKASLFHGTAARCYRLFQSSDTNG